MLHSSASAAARSRTALLLPSGRIGFASLASLSRRLPLVHQSQRIIAFSSTSTTTTTEPLSSFRSQLLETALTKTVPIYGWTDEAIVHAAAELQQPSSSSLAAAGLITVSDLVAFTMDRSNAALQQELDTKEWETTSTDPTYDDGNSTMISTKSTVSLTTKLAWALHRRLELQDDLIQANRWHEGMAIGAQPQNVMRTKQQLASMIDSIANALDPSLSTPERLGLGAIYVAAELHMLTDTAANYQATRDFLQQRVIEWDNLRRLNVLGLVPSSDVLWTVSQVGSAFWSGAQSLLVTRMDSSSSGTSPSDYGRLHEQQPTKIV